jgi:hypothetical protein
MTDIEKLPFYIGKWPDCGCISAVCVDDPKHAKDTAKFVADIIKSGRIVEHLEYDKWEECRHHFRKCPHRSK